MKKNIAGTEERVSASSKFWLCSADCLCTTINSLLTGGGMTYFFTKFLGLSEGRASTVCMIFAIWNALNDPLFGYISDHTKSKLGRRIPYIRYGAFFYSLIFVLTWIRWPLGTSQTALFIQMLSTLFLFDTLYTAIATSLYVMPYTMAVSNKARSGIFLWKIFYRHGRSARSFPADKAGGRQRPDKIPADNDGNRRTRVRYNIRVDFLLQRKSHNRERQKRKHFQGSYRLLQEPLVCRF